MAPRRSSYAKRSATISSFDKLLEPVFHPRRDINHEDDGRCRFTGREVAKVREDIAQYFTPTLTLILQTSNSSTFLVREDECERCHPDLREYEFTASAILDAAPKVLDVKMESA